MTKRWFPLWVFPIVILMAIVTVSLRLAIIRTTYAINQTDKSLRTLQHKLEQTELSLSGLRSPRRLEVLAKTKFGLSQPKSDQVVHLK